jgi:hypothetical protein
VKADPLYETHVPKPWTGGQTSIDAMRRDEQKKYDEILQQVRLADEVGVTTAWLWNTAFGKSSRTLHARKPF